MDKPSTVYDKGYHTGSVPKIPSTVQEVGRRKLRMLNNAVDLADLRIPPANRLEKLSGDLRISTAFGSMTNGG